MRHRASPEEWGEKNEWKKEKTGRKHKTNTGRLYCGRCEEIRDIRGSVCFIRTPLETGEERETRSLEAEGEQKGWATRS